MCEYCERRKIIKSCNFCGSANLIVSGNILDIYGNEKIFNIFKKTYRPRFNINYCPICGKKLGEE